jgi:hypothetical protein
MGLRADMNGVIQKEFLFRLGIKHQPAKKYDVTNYLNTEKKKSNLLLKCPKRNGGKKGAPEQVVEK